MLYASSGVIAATGEDTGALLGRPLRLFDCAWSGSAAVVSDGSSCRLASTGGDIGALVGRPLRLFGCAWSGSAVVVSGDSFCRLFCRWERCICANAGCCLGNSVLNPFAAQ